VINITRLLACQRLLRAPNFHPALFTTTLPPWPVPYLVLPNSKFLFRAATKGQICPLGNQISRRDDSSLQVFASTTNTNTPASAPSPTEEAEHLDTAPAQIRSVTERVDCIRITTALRVASPLTALTTPRPLTKLRGYTSAPGPRRAVWGGEPVFSNSNRTTPGRSTTEPDFEFLIS
jgi:hypothetical protein